MSDHMAHGSYQHLLRGVFLPQRNLADLADTGLVNSFNKAHLQQYTTAC